MEITSTQAQQLVGAIRAEIGRCIVGQEHAIDHVLASFIAGGHVLLEGVPGVGKTMIVLAFAKAIGGQFRRIQFTPDLMPSDITGHMLFDRNAGQFRVRRGPIFGNLVLADEINRAPAKTQAALLEVMQEKQVTIEGSTFDMLNPFMVVATQNPIEQEGTYPLPEAQLDRFLCKVRVEYPTDQEEHAIVRQVTANSVGDSLDTLEAKQVCQPEHAQLLRQAAAQVTVDEGVIAYAVAIARATRSNPSVSVGAGPRAGIALIRLARAMAVSNGRDYVVPDDIKSAALPVLRHRISLTPALEIEGVNVDVAASRILDTIEPPRR